MSPVKFTVSSPVLPLIVRPGSCEAKAPTAIVSLPAPAFTVMSKMPACAILPLSPVMKAAPLSEKVRPGAANLIVPANGSETVSTSPKPERSVTIISPPVVVTS